MTNFDQKQNMTQEQLQLLDSELERQQKSMVVYILLWIFLGIFAIHRFYLGYTGRAICMIFFGWLTFGIWPLIDGIVGIFTVQKTNAKTEENLIQKIKLMKA